MVKEDKHEGMKGKRKKDMKQARDKMRPGSHRAVRNGAKVTRFARDSDSTDMLPLQRVGVEAEIS